MNAPTQQLSIISTYAASRHMEKEALIAVLMKSIAPPEATMEDLVAFVSLAHRFDLDPFAKEIFMIRSRGKVTTYVGIDGYSRIVNRQPEYDGCSFTYDQGPDGSIEAVTCTMHRKDRAHPMAVTEFYSECVPPTPSDAWKRSPGRMLRHRAFVQAARLCFGISGALDEGTDIGVPPIEAGSVNEPAGLSEAPRPRRQPPSPSQRQERQQEPPPADEAAFDLSGLLEAMDSAGTVEELKTIYNDYEVDTELQDQPDKLDTAQNAFIRNNKRIVG